MAPKEAEEANDQDLTDKLDSLTIQDKKNDSKPVEYTSEEIKAIKEVYQNLIQTKNIEAKRIGLRSLALVTIVSKLRIEEASDKYVKLLSALKLCQLDSLEATDTQVEELMQDKDVLEVMKAYASSGRDSENRSIFWIQGNAKGYPPDMEKAYCHGGLLYWLAIHADDISIHEGVTFIIDTSATSMDLKYGNEKKLQKLNQAFPMRPQTIKLAGASRIKRILINGLIRVASLFTKQKILDRIQFVSVEEAVNSIPKESAPRYLGGGGGGIEDMNQWITDRVLSLPIPTL